MNRPLKIVVLGYFGHLNHGDDLLQSALCNLFADHKILFSSWFPGINLINSSDLLVVGGGSLWPSHTVFQHGHEIAKRLKVPLFVLGISAKHDDIEIQRRTVPLIDHARIFHVRDRTSVEAMGGHKKILSGVDLFWGCQSSLDQWREPTNTNSVALNLRSWPNEDWHPVEIKETIERKGLNPTPWPFYYGSRVHEIGDNPTDFELLSSLFGRNDVLQAFSDEPLHTSGIAVCMRFHAVLMAVRAGRPVIGFTYHNKTKSFFDENGLQELCVPLGDLEGLSNALSAVTKNYAYYRSKIVSVRESLLRVGQQDRAMIQSSLQEISPRSPSLVARTRQSVKRILVR